MQHIKLSFIAIFYLSLVSIIFAQQSFPTLIRSSLEDEILIVSIDKSVYYPGDTVKITMQRNDSSATSVATPILLIDGTAMKQTGRNVYTAEIPPTCAPDEYRVRIRVKDSQGRRYIYESDCIVNVEEHQEIEDLNRYISIEPGAGSDEIKTAQTLDLWQIRRLHVVFQRDSIRLGMGPQFVTIRTTVLLRDGSTSQVFERRVLTFRSDNDPRRDRAMLAQYRKAYGEFAAIRQEEFSRVKIKVDSLPDWAFVTINVEPDYTIKIGGYNPANSYTRYYHVRGPKMEIGFILGIPKVLYDTKAKDTIEYGNYSAMVRFYYVEESTGHRFPVNLGFGTFGVNSPIDVKVGGGGFALSVLFNVAEMSRMVGFDLAKKISAGIELTPFFPLQKKARFLLNVQVGFVL